MAAVESAVVAYLRALHPGDPPPTVLLYAMPDRLIAIEVGREAATLVMLLAVAILAGRGRWERFLYFSLAFGIWDICYYVWLWVFIAWPPSLLTWDVLFLIPVPWLAPVLAPVIVSVCLVAGASWLLALEARGGGATPAIPRWAWAVAAAGGVLVLVSFMRAEPPAFRWELFGIGVGAGVAALVAGVVGKRR
ncbi:MAG TPA: hypothetical protein VGQ06_02545 [Gemmatimonadales bacterium]|jgi:hypothetical protein|nr:hypothetical protein [Gemmatimonadales bacterium]